MDPFTLIAGATAIYNGIKSAVGAGEDALKTAERVGNLFSKVAQITQLASAPRKKGLFQSQGEFEAHAVKLYAVKAKAQEMQLETRNLFIGTYGRPAWDNIQREVIEMRKQAAREVAAALKQQEENRKDALMAGGIVLFLILGMAGIGITIMLTTGK
jgi:hypothetical protein